MTDEEKSPWVRCSDRMPISHNGIAEWSDDLLVTVWHPNWPDEGVPPKRSVERAVYHTRLKVWFDSSHDVMEEYNSGGRVLAWRKMPEPFGE